MFADCFTDLVHADYSENGLPAADFARDELVAIVRKCCQRLLTRRPSTSATNTNCIESMISIARDTIGRVKYWKNGAMKKRWIAASMLEAERSFRRIKGHADTGCQRAAGADAA